MILVDEGLTICATLSAGLSSLNPGLSEPWREAIADLSAPVKLRSSSRSFGSRPSFLLQKRVTNSESFLDRLISALSSALAPKDDADAAINPAATMIRRTFIGSLIAPKSLKRRLTMQDGRKRNRYCSPSPWLAFHDCGSTVGLYDSPDETQAQAKASLSTAAAGAEQAVPDAR